MKKQLTHSKRLRISVFRSNRYIYAQIIDDGKRVTVVSASDMKSKEKNSIKRAKEVGVELAKKANEKKVTQVWFDRGNYRYHGRVKALAEGAREGGLQF